MQYAYPYLFLFGFFLYWHYTHKSIPSKISLSRKSRLFQADWIVIIVYLLFYGLRGFIFTDCFQYYDYFTEEAGRNFYVDFVDFRFEPGYQFCNAIIYRFTNNFFVFQFIWTAIDVILLIIILKREVPQYYLLAFAFLIPFFDGIQINLFRNIKGMLICFYAVRYIREKSFFKYFLTITLATTIHVSSIIFFPFYFIINKNLKKIQLLLFVIALFLYFKDLSFMNQIFIYIGLITGGGKIDSVMASYINSTTSAGFTLGLIYRTTLFVLLLYLYNKLASKNLIMLNIAFIYLFCCTAFNSILVMRDRFGQMFALGIVCILPYLIANISGKYKLIFVYFNFFCLVGQVYVQHNNIAAKYENLITGISDYQKAKDRISKSLDLYSSR